MKAIDLTKLVGDVGIGNGVWPDQHGPRSLTYSDTLNAAEAFELDLTLASERGYLTNIQTVWIDNSAGANTLVVTAGGSGQVIRAPAGVSAFYSILLQRDTPKISLYRTDAGAFQIIFLNVPVPSTPTDLAALVLILTNILAANALTTVATRTSVVAATASTPLLAANANRRGGSIFNDSTATLHVALGATAMASYNDFTAEILPRGLFVIPDRHTSAVYGWWSAVAGNARITEQTI